MSQKQEGSIVSLPVDSDLGLAPTKAALIASLTLHRFRVAPGHVMAPGPHALWTAIPVVSGASTEVMAPGGVSPQGGDENGSGLTRVCNSSLNSDRSLSLFNQRVTEAGLALATLDPEDHRYVCFVQ